MRIKIDADQRAARALGDTKSMRREDHGGTQIRGRKGWRSFVALALLALFAVLLRPVCDALDLEMPGAGSGAEVIASDHHSSESTVCCTTLDGKALIASSSGGSDVKPSLGVPQTPTSAMFPPAPLRFAPVDPAQPPPRGLRYHARTARILV
jgi:hypothetical protein